MLFRGGGGEAPSLHLALPAEGARSSSSRLLFILWSLKVHQEASAAFGFLPEGLLIPSVSECRRIDSRSFQPSELIGRSLGENRLHSIRLLAIQAVLPAQEYVDGADAKSDGRRRYDHILRLVFTN